MIPMKQINFSLSESKKLLKTLSNLPMRYWIGVLLILLLASGILVDRQFKKLKQKHKVMQSSVKHMRYITSNAISLIGSAPIPRRLSNLPFGEDLGIIVQTKRVDIRNVIPFNPSLVQTKSGYDLFFRYDVISSKSKVAPFFPNIGVVHLNDEFQQGGQEFKRIDLATEYAEDPRIIEVGDQLYLFYNDLDQQSFNGRFMSLANLNKGTYQVNYTTALDMNLRQVEKNWTPFEYIDEDKIAHLFLEYKIHYPRKLLDLPNPRVNHLRNITLPREASFLSLPWTYKWGEIRGGTPAKKIGNEYLGFFHSCFTEKTGLVWFSMGAYTFEDKPPFRLTGISKHPILFKGIFDTPLIHTAPIDKRVIYPGGFVLEKQGKRELIHVACGENDCGIKIITIDLEKLKKNLIRLEN